MGTPQSPAMGLHPLDPCIGCWLNNGGRREPLGTPQSPARRDILPPLDSPDLNGVDIN